MGVFCSFSSNWTNIKKKFHDEKHENCLVLNVFLRLMNANSTLAKTNHSLQNKKRYPGHSIVFHLVDLTFPSNRF